MGIKDITNNLVKAEEQAFVDFTFAENNVKNGLAPVAKKRPHQEDVQVSATMYQAGVKDDLNARAARIKQARKAAQAPTTADCVEATIERSRH